MVERREDGTTSHASTVSSIAEIEGPAHDLSTEKFANCAMLTISVMIISTFIPVISCIKDL